MERCYRKCQLDQDGFQLLGFGSFEVLSEFQVSNVSGLTSELRIK